MPMQFDRAKLRAAILHICRSTTPDKLGATKLHKVLYFSDMIQYAYSGAPLTGATYKKRPFGPTCMQLLPALQEMKRFGEIEIREVEFYGRKKIEYLANAAPTPGVLNEAEQYLLTEVVDFVCEQNTARSISDFSHQLPWEMVDFGEEIGYNTALLLFPNPVSPRAFEIASEGARTIGNPRSREDTLGLPKLGDLRSRLLQKTGGL